MPPVGHAPYGVYPQQPPLNYAMPPHQTHLVDPNDPFASIKPDPPPLQPQPVMPPETLTQTMASTVPVDPAAAFAGIEPTPPPAPQPEPEPEKPPDPFANIASFAW